MADNVGLLLAAIARLEEKLTDGLREVKEEMAGNAILVERQMQQMEGRIMEKLVIAGPGIIDRISENEGSVSRNSEEGEKPIENNWNIAGEDSWKNGGDVKEETWPVEVKEKPARQPRNKSKKIKFEPPATFAPNRIIDFLSQIETGFHREVVALNLFDNMRMELQPTTDEEVEELKKDKEIWMYGRSQPKEFADLRLATFLTEPSKMSKNICFLEIQFLARICKMLTPLDFVELSLACRFLHWRMFAFCTCYAPYTVQMEIGDYVLENDLRNGFKKGAFPEEVYFSEETDVYPDGNYRGLFVLQPTCFKKPFIFEKLEVVLDQIHFNSNGFDKCLPYILAVRKAAKSLHLVFSHHRQGDGPKFVACDTNAFLETIKASSFACTDDRDIAGHAYIWAGCPYARKLDVVYAPDLAEYDMDPADYPPIEMIPWTSCDNRIGIYENCPLEVVMKSFGQFFGGNQDLQYHLFYYGTQPIDILEHLYKMYQFNEVYASYRPWNRWYTTVETAEGDWVTIAIYKEMGRQTPDWTGIAIGWDKCFERWQHGYIWDFDWNNGHFDVNSLLEKHDYPEDEIWEMTTAMEMEDGDGEEDGGETDEADETTAAREEEAT